MLENITQKLRRRHLIQLIGNFLYVVLIFAIVFDPTNSVFHLKNVVFILLVGFNCLFYKPDLSYLPHILLVYFVVIICHVFSVMQGSIIDQEFLMGIIKGFSPLFLLLWIPYYNVIKLSKNVIVACSILITCMYLVVISDDTLQLAIYYFVKEHDDMIMMTHRNFLGLEIFGMYYKSIISFIFIVYYYYYEMFNDKQHRIRTLICWSFITFSFLISGTRATMLLPFFMFGLVMYRNILSKQKLKYVFFPVLALFVLLMVLVVFMLATQKGEASNAIKYAHLVSYQNLFETHPEYMIFGQGPGAVFYSEGFQKWACQTEWTYLELFRNYGLLSIGILAILLLPLFKLIHYRKNEIAAGFLVAYIFYLAIAGTNPLLISSTGMIVLLMAYSFVYMIENHPEYLKLSGAEFLRRYLS